MSASPVVFRPLDDDILPLRRRMETLLPDTLLPALSNAHPLSLLLFDRGLTYLESFWEGKSFLTVESDGYAFLPAPPPWTLPPDGSSRRTLKEPRFWKTLADTLREKNKGIPAYLDGLPDTFPPQGFPDPELSEMEALLCASDWRHLSGPRHKTHRWEQNRFFRNDPDARVLPWDPLYRKSTLELLERFFSEKIQKSTEDQDRILLDDQWRAHEKALSSPGEMGLSGLVVLSKDRVCGIGWFALLPENRGAIQFLEARDPGMTGISVLLTHHFFLYHPHAPLLNIQGDVQNKGIRHAKRLDLPCRLSPVYRLTLRFSSREFPLP